jgi:hypothetical protein
VTGRAPQRLAAIAVSLLALGCSSEGDAVPSTTAMPEPVINAARCLDVPVADQPVLDLVDGAVRAAEAHYGVSPMFYEVSVDQQRVSMVVAADGVAEQSFYCGDGGFAPPEALGDAEGATFAPGALEIDPEVVYDGVRDELDDPEIVELVAVGNADGTARFALSVRSAAGGVLFVEIGPEGEVLSVQAL